MSSETNDVIQIIVFLDIRATLSEGLVREEGTHLSFDQRAGVKHNHPKRPHPRILRGVEQSVERRVVLICVLVELQLQCCYFSARWERLKNH